METMTGVVVVQPQAHDVTAFTVNDNDDASINDSEQHHASLHEEPESTSSAILSIDPSQYNKAVELKLFCFARPHMRAFHYSWICFCLAFFMWFAIAPLMPEVRDTLDLTDSEVWITNIVAVSSNIVVRALMGAVCDRFGSRICMGVILMISAIPVAMTGTVETMVGLATLRFFIGISGSAFVISQCWASRMFTKEIAGTVNALVAGWGNVGGGLTQVVMGTALFPLFRDVFYKERDSASELAWRTVCIVPAFIAFMAGIIVIKTSDDCPLGNFRELRKEGGMPNMSATTSFRRGAWNMNTWLLFVQYGACFGVELTINNYAATHFVDEFGLSTETASAVASVFGFINLFARGLGGYLSDQASKRFTMKGRLVVQMVLLFLEAVTIVWFARMQELWSAILSLSIFSVFVQAAEGSTFGIVPYVNPHSTGGVAGIVGAGGACGAVVFGFGFLYMDKAEHAYYLMAAVVVLSGVLTLAISIRGHGGIFLTLSEKERWRQSVLTMTVPSPPQSVQETASREENDEAQ